MTEEKEPTMWESANSHTYKSEFRVLIKIAAPIAATSLLAFLMGMIDLAMVGHLGKESLAASALANTWFNAIYFPLIGTQTALDPLLSQSYGAGNYELYGDWLITSLFCCLFLSIPAIILISFTSTFLIWFGQDPYLSELAGRFALNLLFGLIPYLWYNVVSKYLQCQHIVMPLVWVGVISNIITGLLDYLIIYYFDFGFLGAAASTTICRTCLFLMSVYCAYLSTYDKATWPKLSKRPFRLERIIEYLKLGSFGAIMMAESAWAFEITTFLAGLLGTIPLATHVVSYGVCEFFFFAFPFPFALAGSIRVGNELGAKNPAGAIVAAKVVSFLVIIALLTNSFIMFLSRNVIGELFTSDQDAISGVSQLIAILAMFHICDGLQVCEGGVFRAMGKHHLVAFFNFVGFWLLGIGLGVLLTFQLGWGLPGIWYGTACGVFCTTVLLFFRLLKVDWKKEADIAAEKTKIVSSDDGAGQWQVLKEDSAL